MSANMKDKALLTDDVGMQSSLLQSYANKSSISPLLQRVRLYKSPEEIQIMHNASTASHKAFNAVVPHLTQLKTEAELAALLNFRMVQGGGDRWAYEPVVAAEGRGTIVHYTQNDMLLGGSVVIDAGCEHNHYASDITRTYPINDFNNWERQIYNIVLYTYNSCVNLLASGKVVSLDDLWRHSIKAFQQGFAKHHMAYTLEDILKLYPHSLGHYIGMDLHDGPDLPTNLPLKPGMCFTIEPGLYFPDKNYAVRLEDDYTIAEDGSLKRLGTGCAIELDAIDALRRGKTSDLI